jgi:hypothetical protein
MLAILSYFGFGDAVVVVVIPDRIFGKTTGGPVTKGSTRGGIIFKGTQR